MLIGASPKKISAQEEQQLLDDKILAAQQENMARQQQIHMRIHQLLGRAKEKLKLDPLKREERFNKKFQQLKNLYTFIDLEQSLKKLNILNDPVVQQQIAQLKARQQWEVDKRNREIEAQKQRMEAIQAGQALQIEIDYLDDDAPENNTFGLSLLQGRSKEQVKEELRNTRQLLRTNEVLYKAQSWISRKRQQENIDFPSLLTGHDAMQNSEAKLFYRGVEKDLQHREFVQVGAQTQRQKQIEDKYELVKNFLSSKGLDLERRERLPIQSYYENFRQKSISLIKRAEDESKKKFQETHRDELKASGSFRIKSHSFKASRSTNSSPLRDQSSSPPLTPYGDGLDEVVISNHEYDELLQKTAVLEAFSKIEKQSSDALLAEMRSTIGKFSSRKKQPVSVDHNVELQAIGKQYKPRKTGQDIRRNVRMKCIFRSQRF